MKKIVTVLLLITLLFCASCGNENQEKATFKKDVKVDDLASEFMTVLSDRHLVEAEEGYVVVNISIDTSLSEEYTVYIPQSSNADMFGIFKASNEENADKLLEQSNKYLEDLRNNWMSEYLPEELPKVTNSEAKKVGLYVIFVISDDASKATIFDKFTSSLTE